MLGELHLYAGNIDLHGINTIHDIEIFNSTSQHYGTDFAGVILGCRLITIVAVPTFDCHISRVDIKSA